ncbi:cytosolic large ribosomal subunit protein [Malassezia pachydermatis]|uniref:60s ribosomal protein l28 n=1 Tax=Malassezia pachydermatis TaxID=77020 RepID=A0A0M9VR15_9BASI|nr:60s ribosomal protein l28 [Malassezia pachydermatis]KOS16119.1 60s ribosomal protein l28 [Malassezia pachydermatis]
MSTQDLQWLLLRKSNSFLVKQKGLGRVFSREPGNVAALHSYKYSGLVNDKSVGIVPAAGRGVVVSTRKQKVSPNAIKGSRNSTTVKGGSRRVAGAVANMVAKNGYRADLRKPAVARATAIVNAQVRKPRVQRVRAPRGAAARKAVVAAEEQ